MKNEDSVNPPRWADKLLEWLCPEELLEEIQGDLQELFEERVAEAGESRARREYVLWVLGYMRPLAFKRKNNTYTKPLHIVMIQNYVTVTLRNLRRYKMFSLINILGLSIGMACCLLIFQYVAFEYSFDNFHENAPNIYRVIQTTVKSGGEPNTGAVTGWALGPALAQEVPEVAHFTRLHPEYDNAVVSNPSQPDKAFEEEWVYYADSTFFQMFSYPLISGDPERALAEPGTIMLSESMARKYFGKEDPIGQTLDVRGWISGSFRVDGIFQDVPANSHLQFDILLPMVDLLQKSQFSNPSTGWSWTNFITYVQLHEKADLAAVEQKFTEIIRRNQEEEWRQANITGHLDVQPLHDIHLNEDISAPKAAMGSYQAVYFFTIIGLITLLIALVNYVNLTTARALDRAREVGVRKVIGAQRGQLIIQFLSESAFTIFVAFALAVALTHVLMPIVNNLAGTSLNNALWMRQDFWMIFFLSFCLTTLLAGLYPAFVLSSFKSVRVLKGKMSTSATGVLLRRGLVVLQFTASIALLVGTAIVYTQLNYMRNMNLGINLEQILTVPSPRVLPEGTDRASAVETFTQELRRLPAVGQTATSYTVPGKGFAFYTSSIKKAAADPSTEVSGVGTWIDTSFASLYGLELIAGEGFKNISTSTPKGEPKPVIANEAAVRALGFDSAEDAIGQEVEIGENKNRLVGIFKDFNWSSAHQERENAFFLLGRGNPQISIKVNTANLPQTIAAIEQVYKQLFPGNPFQYAFADDTFDMQYRNDQRFARLFSVFAALAMFIACLGLFALAAFTAQQRTIEIGIRKVLGASESSIVKLLSTDFLKLIFIAFFLASPIAWYYLNQWLSNFAYRIEVQWWIFALAGTLALVIGLLTISFQTIKVALSNPVDSLRNE